MADFKLNITDFLSKSIHLPIFDVRSPAEFEHGHIPGAYNLPLFNNEERAEVGTRYVQKGSEIAINKGLEIVRPKTKEFIDKVNRLVPHGEVLLHCWRGGMRSNSMAWLLNSAGIKTYTLDGGYKSYRKHIHDFFSEPLKLVVIGGMTGSGKTDVIEALERKHEQVINLEKLANHKGSVFGAIGMPDQPTTEQFENDLYACLQYLEPDKPTFVEDESLAIGHVFIPRPLFDQMQKAPGFNLVVPIVRRIKQLVNTYVTGDKDSLIRAIRCIEKRLGIENAERAIEHIQNNEMAKAVEVVLRYYDKAYVRSMEEAKRCEVKEILIGNQNAAEIAQIVMDMIHNKL
jgi:tRNA 2-selenouridine synthase